MGGSEPCRCHRSVHQQRSGVVEAGFWQRLKSKNGAAGYTTIKLGYSIEGLMRLDELNQAKRTLASPRADFLKLSEQLRTVGAIVDRRGGQLIRLDRTAYDGMISSFTVQYKMATGELVTEEFSAQSLYDFSVQIFMMEKSRSGNSRTGLAGRLVALLGRSLVCTLSQFSRPCRDSHSFRFVIAAGRAHFARAIAKTSCVFVSHSGVGPELRSRR